MSSRAVLVTGGATGIGWATTQRFLDAGDRVTICQHRKSDIDGIRSELERYGERAHALLADLSTDDGCQDSVADCIDRLGQIDVLVNNAAVTGPTAIASLQDMPDEWMSRIIDVNLKAAYRCSRYASDDMRSRSSGGTIVNVGSIASFVAQSNAVAYAMAKAGLLGLTRALAIELAPYGIRSVMVAPGPVDTPANASDDYLEERRNDRFAKAVPLGTMGEPDDVAAAVYYLCSDAAKFITGSAIVLDGGMLSY